MIAERSRIWPPNNMSLIIMTFVCTFFCCSWMIGAEAALTPSNADLESELSAASNSNRTWDCGHKAISQTVRLLKLSDASRNVISELPQNRPLSVGEMITVFRSLGLKVQVNKYQPGKTPWEFTDLKLAPPSQSARIAILLAGHRDKKPGHYFFYYRSGKDVLYEVDPTTGKEGRAKIQPIPTDAIVLLVERPATTWLGWALDLGSRSSIPVIGLSGFLIALTLLRTFTSGKLPKEQTDSLANESSRSNYSVSVRYGVFALLALGVLCVFAYVPATTATKNAKRNLPEEKSDLAGDDAIRIDKKLDTIRQNIAQPFEFEIKNDTEHAVRYSAFRSTCGCMVSNCPESVVGPGEYYRGKGTITINHLGDFEQRLVGTRRSVQTKTPSEEPIIVEVSGNSKLGPHMLDAMYPLGSVAIGDGFQKAILIAAKDEFERSLRCQSVELVANGKLEGVSIELERSSAYEGDEERQHVLLRITPECKSTGTIHVPLTCNFIDPAGLSHPLQAKVQVTIVPPIAISPNNVLFPAASHEERAFIRLDSLLVSLPITIQCEGAKSPFLAKLNEIPASFSDNRSDNLKLFEVVLSRTSSTPLDSRVESRSTHLFAIQDSNGRSVQQLTVQSID